MPAEPSHLEILKEEVAVHVERSRTQLLDVSHQIHGRPELSFEEHFAHNLLSSVLEEAGFSVERGAYGLATAFVARAGTAGPVVAVLCEYDALPGIGHACGHNVIAAAGLGAALAAASVADRAGGRLVVLGTPGEEGGAGKHQMVEGGCLDGVSAALIVHPAPADLRSMDALWPYIRAIYSAGPRLRGREASPRCRSNILLPVMLRGSAGRGSAGRWLRRRCGADRCRAPRAGTRARGRRRAVEARLGPMLAEYGREASPFIRAPDLVRRHFTADRPDALGASASRT